MDPSKNVNSLPKFVPKPQPSEISLLFRNEFEKVVRGFNGLPQDVLLKIFSHLNEKELQNAQKVCQRWKQGALNPTLWKSLKLESLHTTESVNLALKKIWMFRQLEKVYIKDVEEAAALLRQVYRCLPNLQYLIIRYCTTVSSQTMKAVLRKCHQLKLLDLKGTKFRDTEFFDDLPSLENLRILNLSDNVCLTTKDMIDISLNCRNLEEFYVSLINSDTKDKQLTDEDCRFIVSNMKTNLRGFSIDGATLTDICFQGPFSNFDDYYLLQSDLDHLSNTWCKLNRMELNLSTCCTITFFVVIHVNSLISWMNHLLGLEVRALEVLMDAFCPPIVIIFLIYERILLCDKLEHFGFHRAYNLNGTTFSIIWQYLKNLKTLKLTSGNQIGSRDVETLFRDGRKEVRNLEIIDLTGCWKVVIKNEAIAAISESCPKLKKLIIKCCKNVTNIACLKKSEHLEILNIAFCTRLDIETWLPVQASIKKLFIDQGKNLKKITENVMNQKRPISIFICHSQYKKSFENFHPPSATK